MARRLTRLAVIALFVMIAAGCHGAEGNLPNGWQGDPARSLPAR